jgi:hypothetical protein
VGLEPPPTSDIYNFNAFAAKGSFPVPWAAQSAALNLAAGRIEIVPTPPARAWLVGRARVVADWREAAGRLAAGHDPGTSALLEKELPDAALDPAAAAGKFRWIGFSRNHLSLAVDSPAPGLLVLAEAWHPGWTAHVNGRDAEVFPVNGWMRGVQVPAGAAQVELSFRPRHFFLGLAITIAAALALIWLACAKGQPFAVRP